MGYLPTAQRTMRNDRRRFCVSTAMVTKSATRSGTELRAQPGLHDRGFPLGRPPNRNDIGDRRLCRSSRRDPIDEHRRMGLVGFHHCFCWQCYAVASGASLGRSRRTANVRERVRVKTTAGLAGVDAVIFLGPFLSDAENFSLAVVWEVL